ncbi:Neurochondrin-domain-containing protein [Sordaria brevicollis]|uniref:Neurochondrin-domain-containing protein n=1 Tax=Sordaria brevicollis TaxID=83679 RepID=A0AAE0UEB8_SORBR|nr:Neurochondrin-domain-containing protein [Sordaria brevicollis]
MSDQTQQPGQQPDPIQQAQTLLKAKDDTSRFVGLALLKSVLDNSEELRNNQDAVRGLWKSVPSKFLDRLIKTGSRQQQGQSQGSEGQNKNARDMLDLAVAIIHTFAALVPEENKRDARFMERIPGLVNCLLNCSKETTTLVLETLSSLVTTPDGARSFISLDDVSTLIEIAPSQPLVLDIFFYAFLNSMTSSSSAQDKDLLRTKIDHTITSLVASFKGTDAVTLLDFLSNLLPRLEPQVLPQNPSWLPTLNQFIRNLVSSRPTPAGRAAYTNLAAALLEAYPTITPQLLFTDAPPDPSGKGKSRSTPGDDKPFSYLLIQILLIDIRSTTPTLLSHLNSPTFYPPTARRLSSAFNIISHYLGFLLRSLDSDDSEESMVVDPEFLLKLRTSLSETFSLTLEFLRDRFDASVAGAMGLDPSARSSAAHDSGTGAAHLTLSWESMKDSVEQDPLILAAVRALAIWLREDDNEQLRKEASGLGDLFTELYRSSCQPSAAGQNGGQKLDFRRPVLMAWEGLIEERKGVDSFLTNGGWQVLSQDLIAILQCTSSGTVDEMEAARGTEIVRILLQVAEQERPGPKEEWLDLVTHVAGWYVPDEDEDDQMEGREAKLVVLEFQVAVLQLVTALLVGSHAGVQRRYVHSISAVLGIARVLMGRVKKMGDGELVEALEDVLKTLGQLR